MTSGVREINRNSDVWRSTKKAPWEVKKKRRAKNKVARRSRRNK